MLIQVNTDNNIEGREALADHVRSVLESTLARFAARLSRVEAHLGDENGPKSGGDDKRCMLEARVEGRKPTAVTHHAPTLHQAIDGASDKLVRALDSALGRVADHR